MAGFSLKKISKTQAFIYFLSFAFTLAALIIALNVHLKITWLFSLSYFVIFYSLMAFLTAKPWKALNAAAIFYIVLYLIHRTKLHFYKEPLFFSDIYVMLDPNNWDTVFHYKEAWFLVFFLLLLFFAFFSYRKSLKLGKTFRLLSLAIFCLAILLNIFLAHNDKVKKIWLNTFPAAKETFMNLTMSSVAVNFSKMNYEKVAGFAEKIKEEKFLEQSSDKKPNIVIWLQESTLDASYLSSKLPQAEMFKQSENLKASSLLRVHTFGGATYKSEFGLLAGLNPNYFNEFANTVFYKVVEHLRFSLGDILKKNSYKTIVLSPFNKGSYNGGQAYKALGIDEYYQPQDFGYKADKTKNLWHISSQEMAYYSEKVLEKYKDSKEPIFLYVLTMAEHGPYDEKYKSSHNLDEEFSPAKAGMLSDYFDRQEKLSKAVLSLDAYLKKTYPSYLFLYFGDHQANMDKLTIKEGKVNFSPRDFLTQVFVRGSSNIKKVELSEITDISLVGGLLLELAELAPNDFYKANIRMRKLCNGLVDDCKDEALKESYFSYIFNDLDADGK